MLTNSMRISKPIPFTGLGGNKNLNHAIKI
jgi:hypothetical protein